MRRGITARKRDGGGSALIDVTQLYERSNGAIHAAGAVESLRF